VLAVSLGTAVLAGIASGIVVVLLYLGYQAGRRRKPTAPELDIPRAMQPGPTDGDLEEPLRYKLYVWGVLITIFLALWIPAYWLFEPSANANDAQTMLQQSIDRGRLTTKPGSEDNQLGFNCERCHGPGLHGGQNVFNGNVVVVPNLQTVCGGAKYGHPLITSLDDIVNTIAQGRDGTDMPSWSVKFKGAMDDQQINDIVNYLLSIQKVPYRDNLCINPNAGATPTPAPTATASPSNSPSGSASPTP
jgi:hypothetical protein